MKNSDYLRVSGLVILIIGVVRVITAIFSYLTIYSFMKYFLPMVDLRLLIGFLWVIAVMSRPIMYIIVGWLFHRNCNNRDKISIMKTWAIITIGLCAIFLVLEISTSLVSFSFLVDICVVGALIYAITKLDELKREDVE